MRASESEDGSRRTRFEAFARAAMPELRRYLRRRADADTTDDILSDALLVLWRRFDEVEQLDPELRLPWCFGVARGCLANSRRSAGRRQRLFLRLVSSPESREAAFGVTPTTEPDGDAALARAVEALRDADRELLRLWAWEQLEPREIAVVLGITPNAVSIRLHRATKRLRQRLAGEVATDSEPIAGVDRKTSGTAGHLPQRQDREQSP